MGNKETIRIDGKLKAVEVKKNKIESKNKVFDIGVGRMTMNELREYKDRVLAPNVILVDGNYYLSFGSKTITDMIQISLKTLLKLIGEKKILSRKVGKYRIILFAIENSIVEHMEKLLEKAPKTYEFRVAPKSFNEEEIFNALLHQLKGGNK